MTASLKIRALVIELFRGQSTWSETFRFLFVGGLSFVADFGLLWLLHEAFNLDLFISSVVAFVSSFFVNFYLQKLFTFQARKRTARALALYTTLSIFNTLATGIIVTNLESTVIGWQGAKILSVIMISIWNFFIYKFFIFSKPVSEEIKRNKENL